MGQKLKRFALGVLRQKYLWTLAAFVAIVGVLDDNSFLHRYELWQQNEDLRKEISELEVQFEADTQALNELENNPDAVERVARVNLYMKTADEDVYVIE